MTIPLRGIVEGFYGRPWTHEARIDMFAFMQAHGLNAYIYAPKDDELHRDSWRTPYDAASLAHVSLAGRCGARIMTSSSPLP